MLEVLVAVDANDPLTSLSKFLGSKSANFTSALSRDALKVTLVSTLLLLQALCLQKGIHVQSMCGLRVAPRMGHVRRV